MNERQKYVEQCKFLKPFVDMALMTEDSPRVRAAVLIQCAIDVIKEGTDDPNNALEQFINGLRKTYEVRSEK